MNPAEVMEHFGRTPFEYAVADCCQFVREMIRAETGRDYMTAWTYDDERGAWMWQHFYGSLRECVTKQLGHPIPVERSVDGDVLLIVHRGREWIGYRYLGQCVYKTRKSVTAKSLEFASLAWRVPRG